MSTKKRYTEPLHVAIVETAIELRKKQGLKPLHIGRVLDKPESMINRWERRENWPDDASTVFSAYARLADMRDVAQLYALALERFEVPELPRRFERRVKETLLDAEEEAEALRAAKQPFDALAEKQTKRAEQRSQSERRAARKSH